MVVEALDHPRAAMVEEPPPPGWRSSRPLDEWGNPLPHREGGSETVVKATSVEEAIERYRVDLWRRLQHGVLGLERLAALKGKTLGCWCAPGPCHGGVLVAASEWAAGRPAEAKVAAG
jgi:Domain of unknown function (DUF4326)